MYALIQTGGKQYRVAEGDRIEVERLSTKSGNVEFSQVLLLNDGNTTHIGTPYVEKSLVKGEVIEEKKGPKVFSFKYKRRKNYHRKVGHRQRYLVVKILVIEKGI